ncbi:MAG TPA: hypothetical protein VKQ71_00890, partial [Acidimicrobiales bacterium]|nr:hypothetical protein [Acidimicrobiales bacterium]
GGEVALAAGNPAYAAIHFARAARLRAGSADKADVIDAASQALTLARQSGAPLTANFALGAMANAVAVVDPERARTLLAEAIEAMERLGYQDAIELTQLATVAARLDDWRLTLQLARRAMPRLHWQGDLPNLLLVFNVSALALAQPRPHTAARLQGAAQRVARILTGTARPPSDAPAAAGDGSTRGWRLEATRRLAATLTKDQLTQRRREGEAMDLDDAIAYALAETDETLTDPTSPSTASAGLPACGLEPPASGDP